MADLPNFYSSYHTEVTDDELDIDSDNSKAIHEIWSWQQMIYQPITGHILSNLAIISF